jgi:hypothetical protein
MSLNPVYEFINADARYLTFIKMYNEWRVLSVKWKVLPLGTTGITAN